MAYMIYRHLHTGQLITLREKTYKPDWIRRVTVDVVADIVRDEINSFDNSYVDMLTSIIVERPGMPPISGVACETVFPEDEDDSTQVTLYYYSFPELVSEKVSLAIARPDSTYHPEGEVVDFPDWIIPDARDIYEAPHDEDGNEQEELAKNTGERSEEKADTV